MNESDLAYMPAVELARRIGGREVSCLEVTDLVIRRIEASQPKLNAFITVCAEEARAAACEADAAIARGDDTGPLHGVPVSVKDIINTAGVRTTWGSLLMADNVPDTDAVAVARLRKAGAIVVGKTTTSEFAHKLLTDAPLFGATRNPWAPDRTPGGSSGGSAVAVAAGLGPLSLATDAGASTRLPAACTGIVGLKPTLGVIPHSQVPDGFNNFIHLGVMTRTVHDAALMLDVLAGPHASDPHSLRAGRPQALSALESGDALSGARIMFRPLLGNPQLDHETRSACDVALDQFRAAGCTVDVVDAPTENATPAWGVLQQSNWAARYHATLAAIEDRIDPSFAEGIRIGGTYSGQDLLQATYKRTQYFRAVQGWLADHDFIVTPTISRPPLSVTHRASDPVTVNGIDVGEMRMSWAPYLNLFDLTGHPAVSVPCGWTADGLPIGIQIVGPWYGDANVLKAAALLEAAIPWAQRRPPEP